MSRNKLYTTREPLFCGTTDHLYFPHKNTMTIPTEIWTPDPFNALEKSFILALNSFPKGKHLMTLLEYSNWKWQDFRLLNPNIDVNLESYEFTLKQRHVSKKGVFKSSGEKNSKIHIYDENDLNALLTLLTDPAYKKYAERRAGGPNIFLNHYRKKLGRSFN